MLSFGIRFGQGFDYSSILKVMQSLPIHFNYDLLVIGSNPGGVAFAREARKAGKKTAIIKCTGFSPAEAKRFDEDLKNMTGALEEEDGANSSPISKQTSTTTRSRTHFSNYAFEIHPKSMSTVTKTPNSSFLPKRKSTSSTRKISQSRLDLNNEFFKRGVQCRKLMHNAALLGDSLGDARRSGWRLPAVLPPLPINWKKMSDDVMDYVMKENWSLATALSEESVEVVEGSVEFVNNYTVKIKNPGDATEIEATSALICLALPSVCILPAEVPGAKEYGITCDDFIRMNEPPGKTLVVGSLPEGLECAGIVACCRFPVTVVSRSTILENIDSDMSEMILNDLKERGVKFMENTKLESVELTPDKKLLASFTHFGSLENLSKQELFDTVLFAVGRKVFFDDLNIKETGVEFDAGSQEIRADGGGTTSVPNIFVVSDGVADRSTSFSISELSGRILGERLFQGMPTLTDYSMTPTIMYTPTEYASVGISEDVAKYRLGPQCIEVYSGYFTPLDFVIPPKKAQCFAKIITHKESDRIIGLQFFGPDAGEIIQGFAAALKNKLTMSSLRTLIGVTGTKAEEILKLKQTTTHEAKEKEAESSDD